MKLKRFFTVFASGTLLLSAVSGQALAGGKTVSLVIESSGDQMKFNKSEISVSENSNVTLTFNNKSASLTHNWVLVKSGTGDQVSASGIAAGEGKSWLTSGDKNVIAFTKAVKPGKTVSVTFKAPKKGTYDFVCTSPGHNSMMKGKFIVK